MKNLSIEMLETMPLDNLTQLSSETLFELQGCVNHEMEVAKAHAKMLAAALSQRYATREKEARLATAKPTGRIRFNDEGFVVTAEAPKQVHWDRDLLAAAFDKFPAHIAEQYAKWSVIVEERRYAEAPPILKAALEPARTVAVGRSSYHLEYKDNETADKDRETA